MNRITTFLTFEQRAEEAVNFYISIFKNSKIHNLVRMPGESGGLLHASFELDGQLMMAMDGGPHFSFAQGHSLFVNCQSQEEVDYYWQKLSDGGEQQPCGWLKDKFGVSWQVVPSALSDLMQAGNAEQSKRVFEAMLKMTKIDIAVLEKAFHST